MVPSSRIMVYILYHAIIILNYAHIFAYGTISRVSSGIYDHGVMNKRVLQGAVFTRSRRVSMAATDHLSSLLGSGARTKGHITTNPHRNNSFYGISPHAYHVLHFS